MKVKKDSFRASDNHTDTTATNTCRLDSAQSTEYNNSQSDLPTDSLSVLGLKKRKRVTL